MAKHNIIKQIKTCECGGELQFKKTLFNFSKVMKQRFKKEFGKTLTNPTGFYCLKCGACYDEELKPEGFSLGHVKIK